MAVDLGEGLSMAPGSIVFELGRRLEVVPVGTVQQILRGLGLRWPGLDDNTWGKRTERGWVVAADLLGVDSFIVKSPYDSTERPAKYFALVVPATLSALRVRARQTDQPLLRVKDPFARKPPTPPPVGPVLPPISNEVPVAPAPAPMPTDLPEPASEPEGGMAWAPVLGIALLGGAALLYFRQR